MIKRIFFYLWCIYSLNINAQIKNSVIDSIIDSVQKEKLSDSTKIKKLVNISAKFRYDIKTKKLIEKADKLAFLNGNNILML